MVASELTEAERIAKDHVLKCVVEAADKQCDGGDKEFGLPKWYDEAKYKRGQKYFLTNRFGIMQSNLYGLFSLLCEPRGLNLLDSTGRSSTSETARKRYASTTLHMLHWYQADLVPGSKSWESLKRVRKMHACASKASENKGIGFISQNEMCATVFGFMGYALIRPEMLGIFNSVEEDLEGFVHFWAVIGHMLGIEDKYNICLFPMDVVEAICKVYLRYFFMAWLQLETPLFKKMVKAVIDGLGRDLLPLASCESSLFLAKRIAGIPGYQYGVDLKKEIEFKNYFDESDFAKMKESFAHRTGYDYLSGIAFTNNFYLIDIKKLNECQEMCEENSIENQLDNMDDNRNIFGVFKKLDSDSNNNNNSESIDNFKGLIDLFELKHHSELLLTEMSAEDFPKYLNDNKFKNLSWKDQMLVRNNIFMSDKMRGRFFKNTAEYFLNTVIKKIVRAAESRK